MEDKATCQEPRRVERNLEVPGRAWRTLEVSQKCLEEPGNVWKNLEEHGGTLKSLEVLEIAWNLNLKCLEERKRNLKSLKKPCLEVWKNPEALGRA